HVIYSRPAVQIQSAGQAGKVADLESEEAVVGAIDRGVSAGGRNAMLLHREGHNAVGRRGGESFRALAEQLLDGQGRSRQTGAIFGPARVADLGPLEVHAGWGVRTGTAQVADEAAADGQIVCDPDRGIAVTPEHIREVARVAVACTAPLSAWSA